MTRRGWAASAGMTCAMVLLAAGVASAQWQVARLLNDPSENAGDLKTPAICAASGGGFHAVYRYHAPKGIRIQYRRFLADNLSPVKTLFTGYAYAGSDVCEAGNGDLHAVWEYWHNVDPDYFNVGWSKSSDGGLTWSPGTEITSAGYAKTPYLAPFGGPGSPDVIMSFGNSPPAGEGPKEIWFSRYNGTFWSGGGMYTGQDFNSEYEIHNITQSLQDGTVYRSFTNGDKSLVYQRYNGLNWSTSTVLDDSANFYPRATIAVNPAGQIMVTWDYNSSFWSTLYTPGSGWSSPVTLQTNSGHGMVTAIPGTNNFYAVYCKADNRVRGRFCVNGAWQAEETVSVDQAQAFTTDAQVVAAADGTIYAAWEYWGAGPARLWFSVRPGSPPPASGTLSGVVRDQYGHTVANASITTSAAAATVSGPGGNYSMSVPEGTHNVLASKDYYRQTVSGVTITANQTMLKDFTITGDPPAPVSGFVATPGNTVDQLSWQNPASPQTNWVRVLVKMAGYPSGPNDPTATVLVDRPAQPNAQETFSHTGLTNATKYYYSVYCYFLDASTAYYAPGVQAATVPFGPGDHDHDGDVDMDDFAHFQLCLSGAAILQDDPNCSDAKFDGDSDVDEVDLSKFRSCFRGPNILADPACASGA